ncbi:Hypothetical predicted protein [Mytilus galloprovincialis]|uniref:Uncharacterized protein n=1 Tax=Mytilus galloprovincialis TaxID=29158 RepID=A0A8B6FBS4_MYTGA|nr:Hypothetical predicted protein [Mytilus galloprovincialis]
MQSPRNNTETREASGGHGNGQRNVVGVAPIQMQFTYSEREGTNGNRSGPRERVGVAPIQSSTGDSDTSDVNVSTRAPSGRKECEEDGEDYQEREVMTDNQEREVVVDAQYFGHLVDDMPTLFIPDSTCSSFDEILQTYEEETLDMQARNSCNCGICVQCEGFQIGHTNPTTDVGIIGNLEFPVEFLFSRK